jgi:hypothetical protein
MNMPFFIDEPAFVINLNQFWRLGKAAL